LALCAALTALHASAAAQGATTAPASLSPSENAGTDHALPLNTATGTLNGSLRLPALGKTWPLVVIIAGSGPTDRDGNSTMLPGHNDSLKLLAEALANAGIASLRYDKRGVAASAAAGAKESDLRFDMYVDDAKAWVSALATDGRFSSVSLLGHSEGALIASLAAAQNPQVRALVTVAGAGRSVGEVLREQLAGKLPPELAAHSEALLSSLERGETVSEVPAALNVLYRPSVQPYLISWIQHPPAAALSRVKQPTLIVQGDSDLQITPSNAHLLKAARPASELVLVPGMNHVLKAATGNLAEQRASYSSPDLPLAPGLMPAIVDFLKRQTANAPTH